MKNYRIPRKLKKKIRRNPKLITEAQFHKLMESYLISTPIFKEMRRQLDVLFIGADFREIELK